MVDIKLHPRGLRGHIAVQIKNDSQTLDSKVIDTGSRRPEVTVMSAIAISDTWVE